MLLERYLSQSRIIDIKSKSLKGALGELITVATERLKNKLNHTGIIDELLRQENTVSTYLGNGISLPHIRLKINRNYILAVGRCVDGISDERYPEYKQTRLIIILLASEKNRNYLNDLATLARIFKEKENVDQIIEADTIKVFRERIQKVISGTIAPFKSSRQTPFNRIILKEADKIAKAAKCSFILVFRDTFFTGIESSKLLPKFRTVIISQNASEKKYYLDYDQVEAVISVRAFSSQRMSQLRSAILLGLTKGIFTVNDRLCCIGGIPQSNQLDTLVIVDIPKEFSPILEQQSNLLPDSVRIEVLERIFVIATELSVEGREGHPVGALFVIGDTKKVNAYTKPLIMNPFYGYKEEERNVLNPFMDETIKELSSIDGAFIIQGDGVIESAGVLLVHSGDKGAQELPSGLGARHAAAMAISCVTDCIALTVSSSTGQLSLFRQGVILPLIEKTPVGRI